MHPVLDIEEAFAEQCLQEIKRFQYHFVFQLDCDDDYSEKTKWILGYITKMGEKTRKKVLLMMSLTIMKIRPTNPKTEIRRLLNQPLTQIYRSVF